MKSRLLTCIIVYMYYYLHNNCLQLLYAKVLVDNRAIGNNFCARMNDKRCCRQKEPSQSFLIINTLNFLNINTLRTYKISYNNFKFMEFL